MTTAAQYERVIDTWMNSIIRGGDVDRYDDLHIDRIDEAWKNRENWIKGGLQAYRLALEARNRQQANVTISLVYSLSSREEAQGVNFSTPEEFQAQLDWSPPSLYLFHPGKEPWNEITSSAGDLSRVASIVMRNIDPVTVFGTATPVQEAYYMEFKPADSDEYSRSVSFAG